MNNKFKFYRVEHTRFQYTDTPVRWGPYTYIHYLRYQKTLDTEPNLVELDKLMGRNEPATTNPKKNRLARIGLFSTFVDRRPGPKEDPYLRGKLRIGRTLFETPYVFGFDSEEQLNGWFHDVEERHQLDRCEFTVGVYYVKNLIRGLRQAVVNKQDVMYRIESLSLVNNIQGITYENLNGIASR